MVWLMFIIILGLLVFVHELGHFIMARRNGVRVEEFGLGFPPRIFSLKRGETIYSINLFPLGGFVKIYGEDGEGEINVDHFASKTIWQRSKIIVAGVVMNLILGWLLLSGGYSLGLPTAVEDGASGVRVQITGIAISSPAELASLKIGDIVESLRAGDQKIIISGVEQFQKEINFWAGQTVELNILRGSKSYQFLITPRSDPPKGEGPLGVSLANMAVISYPWYEAVPRAFVTTLNLVAVILLALFKLLKDLLVSGQVSAELAGPVGIFNITGQFSKLGFVYLLQLTAMLTINLAVINILPLPALDGGRLALLALEKFRGAPLNNKTEKMINSIGFIFLIFLIVLVTVRDVIKLF